ncbi:hypothetical protein Y032_0017g3367 [Ancylostoma ceylanicum]|nr:hypothetical protein Y032_0017g3367 [Ancylostoma ceylanicum]
MLIAAVTSLSLTERNEMSRKFKYYFNSVRPTAPENFISGVNGSFFKVAVEFHLVGTQVKTRSLLVDAVVVFHWIDDRLVLRELFDDFELPKEFEPWLPRVRTIPAPHTVTVVLSPATGVVSLYHRVKDVITCSAVEWKHPFETFDCELQAENAGDEVLTMLKLRDLRSDHQTTLVGAELSPFPLSTLKLQFSAEWNSALLSVFLPSVLIVTLVFFAQWKRRKVQILVSLAAIMSILVLLVSSRPYHSATLLDLWICGCFIHAVFLLLVDLTLPARRVRYALLVDVEDHESKPRQTVLKCQESSQRSIDLILKWAERKLGLKENQESTTQVFALPPEAAVVQRQVTTTTLGERKRIALVVVGASYIVFTLIYSIIIFSIN